MTDKGGHVHIFPFKDEAFANRQDSEVVINAREATERSVVVKGFKGPSIFSHLTHYSLTMGTGIDAMHGIFLGIMKQLMSVLFLAGSGLFASKVDKINHRLKQIFPPLSVKRPPRVFAELGHYKASEFCCLLVMYAPLFYGIIPDEYMASLSCLSYAVFILYQSHINNSQLDQARRLLSKFQQTFSTLYGNRYQTLNFHNLVHLVDDVQNIGPLWAFDCFAFENASGQMLKLLHGTQHIDTQILKAVSISHKLPILLQDLKRSFPGSKASLMMNVSKIH